MLTAGGDCPGLNAVIRAVVRRGLSGGHEPAGLWRGYAGLAERSYVELDMRTVSGILHLGGTILSHGTEMTSVPPSEVEGVKHVYLDHLRIAATFFG